MLSGADRLRSALARVKIDGRRLSTMGLQTDEWRRALAVGMQRASDGTSQTAHSALPPTPPTH